MRVSRFASSGHPDHAGDAWPAWVPAPQRRRQDPFTRLACAVVERLLAQGTALDPLTAVVVSTSYGAVESTLRFAGGIAQYGDGGASPTPFTTSVHNSCAAALGEFLHLHGPSTTISQGGTGGLAALRWASLLLSAGRAPAVLVVAGDRHNDWSHRVVTALSASPWPVADGVAALLLEPGAGPGRELRLGAHPARRTLDGGALAAADELRLARAATGTERAIAPRLLGGWWPCCLLAALPWPDAEALQLREAEDGQVLEAWLGPHV
jgi:hypothetical protein